MARRRTPSSSAPPRSLAELRDALRAFARARDWEPFHTPKNLAMSLAIEAAEVMEHFQWLTAQESLALEADTRVALAHEIADVLIYLVRLADVTGIDPLAAAHAKMVINDARYPALASRGKATRRPARKAGRSAAPARARRAAR